MDRTQMVVLYKKIKKHKEKGKYLDTFSLASKRPYTLQVFKRSTL